MWRNGTRIIRTTGYLCGKVVVALLLLLSQRSPAAFERVVQGARPVALAGAVVALPGEVWGTAANPAALPTVSCRTLSVSVSPGDFGLVELGRVSAIFVEPFGHWAVGFFASRFGYELYRETTFALAAGFFVTEAVRCGIGVNCYALAIKDYGHGIAFGVDAGASISFSEQLCYGFSLTNINAPTIGEGREKILPALSTGISYRVVPEAILSLDLQKDFHFPSSLCFGFEYVVAGHLALRGGMASEPSTYAAGVGLSYALFQLDYAFSVHPELGLSHKLSLAIRLGDQ